MENCPGWGNIWTQFELDENLNIIYENPEFINSVNWNFELNNLSPCIDTGNPDIIDIDGTISDIGAKAYNQNICMLLGDVNFDELINVLDIVQFVCFIIQNSSNCNINIDCGDINGDNLINILDIVILVNIII